MKPYISIVMPRRFRSGRLPKNYARNKVVNKQGRMPVYPRQQREPQNHSHESFSDDDELSNPIIIDLVDHDNATLL